MSNQEFMERLRQEIANVLNEVLPTVNQTAVSRNDLEAFAAQIYGQLQQEITANNQNIATMLRNEIQDREIHQQATPRHGDNINNDDSGHSDAPTNYDLDHDVVMRGRITYPIAQVPDPGLFTGVPAEAELFCELCHATFEAYPNNLLPDDARINFVKTRLREAARNWYLTKYKGNVVPATLQELLDGLKAAFPNVESKKLAQIQMLELKHNYGNINQYIESFRSYSNQLDLEDKSLALFFYNGLHPKYKEEIKKMENLPSTLEAIITKCILLENSFKIKNKISSNKTNNTNKKPNKKSSYKSPKSYNYNNKYNNNNNNNSSNNYSTTNVKKVTTKN